MCTAGDDKGFFAVVRSIEFFAKREDLILFPEFYFCPVFFYDFSNFRDFNSVVLNALFEEP
jgi:hypothetical protein